MKNEKFCFNKGVGLIALVGIVLVGFVLASQILTSTKTSTNSRASAPAAPNKINLSGGTDSWCQAYKPFGLSTLDTSKDTCINTLGRGLTCGDNAVVNSYTAVDKTSYTGKETTSGYCGGDCCRSISGTNMNLIGDAKCKRELNNTDAYCPGAGSCPNNTTAVTGNKCGYVKGLTSTLYESTCCNPPLSLSLTDCGKGHLDCSKLGDGVTKSATSGNDGSYSNNGMKNTDVAGNVLVPKCVKLDGQDDAACAYLLSKSNVKNLCDGQQFAFPVYNKKVSNNLCLATLAGAPSNYGSDVACRLYEYDVGLAGKCKDYMVDGRP